jgi:hypothetical protein
MPFDLEKIMSALNTFGVLGMFVFLAVALHWKWIALGYQVTELKQQLEEVKAERNELLRHAFRSVKVFSKAIGHEITPRPGLIPDDEGE